MQNFSFVIKGSLIHRACFSKRFRKVSLLERVGVQKDAKQICLYL